MGYVQIDTINVIERAHHRILWTRIPGYDREHLHQAQTVDKTVFEASTHALSYVPARDLKFFLPAMRRARKEPRMPWNRTVKDEDIRRVVTLIRKTGALTIRDIKDDVLVEKDWAWASRKPSKRALDMAFHWGLVTISERAGMVKTYELIDRHFGWDKPPRPATDRQVLTYRLDRALRSQGLVSLDSTCHLSAKSKPAIRALIEARVQRRELVPVTIEGTGKVEHWTTPHTLDTISSPDDRPVHILSPFDPLIIQRKRLALFFDYNHPVRGLRTPGKTRSRILRAARPRR
ncbi:DNA glycosylase AlkZ-like family protein [Actinopolymorpha alba]|uniref:DNA glycosylase AlkZ-like family protein n=1 Tax=Actinopolymorpha alba TaxID=533267 RepID=UPI00039AFDA5|nr:winged helix DNA-binding domain-containing protein [Actinopolymorpha alba]